MPLRPCANGEPTSIPAHSFPTAEASRPHCRASGVNDPPRVSVADVSTTVLSANRCSASTSPTSSGATCSDAGRALSDQSSGRSSQTTSSRSAIGWSKAVIIRSATDRDLLQADQRGLRRGDLGRVGVRPSPSCAAIFRTCAAHADRRVPQRGERRAEALVELVHPPARQAWPSSGVSALPASDSRAISPSSASRPVRRTAKSIVYADSSPLATDVTRSTSSCASSTITTR